MNRKYISIIALLTGPLGLFVFSSCAVPDPAHQEEDVSETHQALQICSSSCSAWGGNPVSCAFGTTCQSDPNGVTCDGGTAQQQTISCSCANLSVTLTTNPTGYASPNQTVTWTAHPSGGSGNYTYTWVETWCWNGTAAGDCNGSSVTWTSTTPTKSINMAQYSYWQQYCVSIHDNACSAYGNAGPACARVNGDGACPRGKICPQ